MRDTLNILQFGESGQLARELGKACARDGRLSVTTISRAQADFNYPENVAAAIKDARPFDVAINAVAYTAVDKAETEVEKAHLVNAASVGALADTCKARGVPLIHISTDYVYDGHKQTPYVEDDPVDPINAYGLTKLAGEDLIRASLPAHVILRTSWVYSAHGANFVKTMLRLGAEREELRIVDDQLGAPTSAVNLASAVLEIAWQMKQGSSQFGTFHFSDAGETTWRKFAEEIFHQASWARIKARVSPITSADYPTPARRPANSRLELNKIRQGFGITPLPWEESLTPVLAALRESIS